MLENIDFILRKKNDNKFAKHLSNFGIYMLLISTVPRKEHASINEIQN